MCAAGERSSGHPTHSVDRPVAHGVRWRGENRRRRAALVARRAGQPGVLGCVRRHNQARPSPTSRGLSGRCALEYLCMPSLVPVSALSVRVAASRWSQFRREEGRALRSGGPGSGAGHSAGAGARDRQSPTGQRRAAGPSRPRGPRVGGGSARLRSLVADRATRGRRGAVIRRRPRRSSSRRVCAGHEAHLSRADCSCRPSTVATGAAQPRERWPSTRSRRGCRRCIAPGVLPTRRRSAGRAGRGSSRPVRACSCDGHMRSPAACRGQDSRLVGR